MDESKSKEQQQKGQRRFNQEQYDFLKKCSEKGEEGIKEWNEWRKKKENSHKEAQKGKILEIAIRHRRTSKASQ